MSEIKVHVATGYDQAVKVGEDADFTIILTFTDGGVPVKDRPYRYMLQEGEGDLRNKGRKTDKDGAASATFTPSKAGHFKILAFAEGLTRPIGIFNGEAIAEENINLTDEDLEDAPTPVAAEKPRTSPPPLPFEAAAGPAGEFFAAGEKMQGRALEPWEPAQVLPFPVVRPPPRRKFAVSYNMLLALILASVLAAAAVALLT
ncbi:MAG: hypothetical protein HY459_03555 [Parcubacteria group bacterium]|nr:hypothetical protein [Parcubacteria group bacterium]MBI4457418.1 hypothetical protein [Candidatus Uhrbacteria bacterium]